MTWRDPGVKALLLLMESIWIYAVVVYVVALTSDVARPPFLTVVAIVVMGYGLSRLLQAGDLSLGVIRVWGTLLSLIIFYAIVRVGFFSDWRFWDFTWSDSLASHLSATVNANSAAVLGIALLWIVWMRGILRGQETLGWESVFASFGTGLLIVGVVELLQAASKTPAPVGSLAVPYVAVGLLAVSLAQTARSRLKSTRSFVTTAALAGLVVVLMAAFALAFSLIDFGLIGSSLGSAASTAAPTLEKLGGYLLWPLGQAMEYGFLAVRWLLTAIFGHPKPTLPQEQGQAAGSCIQSLVQTGLTQAQAAAKCATTPGHIVLPGWAALLIRVLIGGAIVSVIALSVAILFIRRPRRRKAGEVRESAYTDGRLASDVGGLLGSLLNRLRPRVRSRGGLDAIRRLYFDLLEAGERRGLRRGPAETPLELASRLDRVFAAPLPGRITEVFADTRYGAHSPSPEIVDRLRSEWETLRQAAGVPGH